MTSQDPQPVKSTREQKAAALRADAVRKQKRRTLTLVGALVGLGGLLAGGIALQASRTADIAAANAPANTTGSTAFLVGDPYAPVSLDVYEDFQCPACKAFEDAMSADLDQLVAAGKVKVNYHMLSFLGPESDRATAAAGCAADAGQFAEFHRALFLNQPAEHTGGFTKDQLIELGNVAGVIDPDFVGCVNSGTYATWADLVDDEGSKRGIMGTPTFFVDGDLVDPKTANPQKVLAALNDAVEAAEPTSPDDATSGEQTEGAASGSTGAPAADTDSSTP